MVFDYQGRLMFFDCVAFVLKNQSGLANTLMTMASYYKAYVAYLAIPYVS